MDLLMIEKLTSGVIVKVNKDGLGFLEEDGTKFRFAFTFDKISGYKGESAMELGLYPGVRVRFAAHRHKIRHIERPSTTAARTSAAL
jgi:hypothetical protein